jgi:hypothetical protein
MSSIKKKVQIFIDKKEVLYSHPNMVIAINSWLPYLTNTDLDELIKRIGAMRDHREEQEKLSREECKNIPIQSNRHDT